MELLILGGLSMLGNELSKRSSVSKKEVPTNEYTRQNTNAPNPSKLQVRPVAHQFDPNMTHNNMVPFYKSQRSQNTNDAFKDRRLATFTGVDNLDFQKKKELLQRSPESQITHPFGTTFQPDIERYKDYVASGIHNNVAPVDKQYIGPGLGSAASSSTHGFHEMFRIMPDNINVTMLFFDDRPIGITLPNFVELQVTYCEPGVKGDTASGAVKPATLSSGGTINVPLFVEEGQWLKIDTRTNDYVERVKR